MTVLQSWRILATLCMAMAPSIALATNGTELLSACQHAETIDREKPSRHPFALGKCLGILEGVHGAMSALKPSLPQEVQTCFPKGEMEIMQAVRIVMKYLRENPEQHHESAAFNVAMAYALAFPCKP